MPRPSVVRLSTLSATAGAAAPDEAAPDEPPGAAPGRSGASLHSTAPRGVLAEGAPGLAALGAIPACDLRWAVNAGGCENLRRKPLSALSSQLSALSSQLSAQRGACGALQGQASRALGELERL